jgi:16S rRNA (cytidine1402-2'-O)-methyltransferase
MLRIQESFRDESGPKLYVCSTPIGNLDDVSQRLVDTLRTVDVVAAEDTRHTRKLLSRFDIHPRHLVSCHEHNETERLHDLDHWFGQGWTVALVSDAGTPLVSDPGRRFVEHAVERGVPVIPVPGPSAALAALVASALPAQPFTFYGFLPREAKARVALFAEWPRWPGSVVCYEAPHRLRRSLADLAAVLPAARVALAKELTKRHEAFIRGTAEEVAAWAETADLRGEYVLVVDPGPVRKLTGAPEGALVCNGFSGNIETGSATGDMGGDATQPAPGMEDVRAQAVAEVRRRMAAGEPHAAAVREVARRCGLSRRELYQATLPESGAEDAGEEAHGETPE